MHSCLHNFKNVTVGASVQNLHSTRYCGERKLHMVCTKSCL